MIEGRHDRDGYFSGWFVRRGKAEFGPFDTHEEAMALYRQDQIDKYRAMPLCDELTKRAMTGWAYWLDASPHERTEEDGMIVAHYARLAFERMCEQEKELEALKRHLRALDPNAEL